MGAAVDDVHHRHGQDFGVRAAEVFVEWKAKLRGGGFGRSQRDGEDRIGAENFFGRGAVEREHGGIDCRLLRAALADDGRGDLAVHVLDGLEHSLAQEAGFVAVAELDGFIFSGGCAGRHRGASDRPALEPDVNFNRGIAARVDHFAAADFNNGRITHNVCVLVWKSLIQRTGRPGWIFHTRSQ